MRATNPISMLLTSLTVVGCLALTACSAAGEAPETEPASGASGADTPANDEELLRAIRPSFTDSTDRAAVAVIDAGGVRTAFIDADESTVFEVGSITKVFTGELLAEAIERGEVRADDELGAHLDLGDAPVASVTLRDLAAHTAGLPIFPDDPEFVEAATADIEAGGDGIDATLDDLLEHARSLEITPGQGFSYSNIGAALVGQALAAAAGADYGTILSERLLEPLGLDGVSLPLDDAEVPSGHAVGFDSDGDAVEPSTLGAYAPAGGIHATVGDLVKFANAVIDGQLAGSAAQTDTVDVGGGTSMGYFWSVDDRGDRRIVSHNGLTGGFASVLFIDVDAGTAAIVLSNQADGIDQVGETLLDHVR
ncbi:serine hydrolase [Agromyces sp. Marseille-P2726]|uniref:serine hydrolase domain-containing protein n=1 Tax=Agromyces sp. Marseille-P2726 TaxID=2709132 RepID=UPI0015708368|nr:serine hydrolase domain-containing protein [Agromyces sp. Marseille-P2726]